MRRLKKLRVLLSYPISILLVILILILVLTGWLLKPALDLSHPEAMMQTINQWGWAGVLFYIGFQVLAIVVSPIPGTPVTVAAGAIWGPIAAGIYGSIGVFLGSVLAYLIGRTLGRSTVKALTGKVIYFSQHRGEVYLGWLMFISHLIPVLPCDLMSYGAGIAGMSLPLYVTTTLLGTIPCTFFLTYMGSAFTVEPSVAIALLAVFLVLLIGLPWGVKRYNWLGLKDVIRVE